MFWDDLRQREASRGKPGDMHIHSPVSQERALRDIDELDVSPACFFPLLKVWGASKHSVDRRRTWMLTRQEFNEFASTQLLNEAIYLSL